jgi:ABC-2 type transport system permease protein
MPVHDLGYRQWSGKRMPRFLRPWVVARGGISLVWRRRWLRMMLMMAWLPIIVPALAIFAFEYSSTDPEIRGVVVGMLRSPLIQRGDLAAQAMVDPTSVRHEVWSILILFFFRYPQLVVMVMLVGLIAPMLISYDLRSKAYLMYFSRPLTPAEYILGKSAVVWFLLIMIVTVPAIVLYLLGVLLSPDLSVVIETWDIPLRVLAATVILVVPTTAVALCYSSFTSESRYATFAWFATWVMGYVSYTILTFARVRSRVPGPPTRRARNRGPDWEELGIDLDRWRLLSPYHALGKVESWVFGSDPTDGSVYPSLVLLVIVTIVALGIIRHRIIARLNV